MNQVDFLLGVLSFAGKLKFFYACFGICVASLLIIESLRYFANKANTDSTKKIKLWENMFCLVLGLAILPLHGNMILILFEQLK